MFDQTCFEHIMTYHVHFVVVLCIFFSSCFQCIFAHILWKLSILIFSSLSALDSWAWLLRSIKICLEKLPEGSTSSTLARLIDLRGIKICRLVRGSFFHTLFLLLFYSSPLSTPIFTYDKNFLFKSNFFKVLLSSAW